MSSKEKVIEWVQELPDNLDIPEILAALQEAQATQEALRRYDERGGIPDEDLTDEEWRATIARSLADELNDPRQDIYPDDEARRGNELG
jgi:hypothetical protein